MSSGPAVPPVAATAGGGSAEGPAGPLPAAPAHVDASRGSASCGAAAAVSGGSKPLHAGTTPQEGSKPTADGRPTLEHAPSSMHSVHLSNLAPHEVRQLSRLRITGRDLIEPPPTHRSPLVRSLRWWRSWAVPGMGMFVEAWMVFAIGNIKPFLALDMPHCFGEQPPYSCSQSAADAVTYVEVCGIILGMLALGFFADVIGRKWGSRLASSVMLLGGILLTSCAGSDSSFLAMFLASLFVLGMGVGGEYPVASSSAAERAEGSKAMRQRRGETVVLTFSQQGWGNLSNTLCIILLLAMQGATGAVVTPKQAEITWRVQFAVGTAICLALAVYRWTLLQESKVWSAERSDAAGDLPHKGLRAPSRQHYAVLLRHYWPRLLVTSTAWLLNDFAFYGHKLFQSNFIGIVIGEATNFKRKLYTLLNSGIALIGYYAAAMLIDARWYGRTRMQAAGFAMLFILFLLCATLFDTLTQHTAAFQVLYYLASFFNQFGPNCTTWLVAGEVYPTGVRSFFHGLSAAAGKVGALVAAAAFSHISERAAFYASAGAGLAGFLVTLLFLPDTTGLDLHEIDRMNRYLLAGHLRNYHGEAVNPRYLSLYERWRSYDENYDPERDYAHKQLQLHPHLAEATASLASLASAGAKVDVLWWVWCGTVAAGTADSLLPAAVPSVTVTRPFATASVSAASSRSVRRLRTAASRQQSRRGSLRGQGSLPS